jgi:hypothetical protein
MKWCDLKKIRGKRMIVVEEQRKTGERVVIRVHRELALLLERTPRTSKYILTNLNTGRAYTEGILTRHVREHLAKIAPK